MSHKCYSIKGPSHTRCNFNFRDAFWRIFRLNCALLNYFVTLRCHNFATYRLKFDCFYQILISPLLYVDGPHAAGSYDSYMLCLQLTVCLPETNCQALFRVNRLLENRPPLPFMGYVSMWKCKEVLSFLSSIHSTLDWEHLYSSLIKIIAKNINRP